MAERSPLRESAGEPEAERPSQGATAGSADLLCGAAVAGSVGSSEVRAGEYPGRLLGAVFTCPR